MGLLFVPVYIRLMGVEAYGIVGIYISLQAVFAVLDLGLSQTLAREMARLSVDSKNVKLMANTAHTLEIIYWAAAVGVTLVIVLSSHFIAYYWLNPQQLSRESLRDALWVMAFVIGIRWPMTLYMGGLNGLQRQVLCNTLLACFATLQGIGAIAALWFVAPTIEVFFCWQALISLFQVLALQIALWKNLPFREARFCMDVLKGIWRFALGMTGIALLATILTQLDKLLLSKLLSLSEFGYYVFASTVAAALFKLTSPVFTAYLPRFTELASIGDQKSLIQIYHRGCQLMALVTVPAAMVLAFFSMDILMLWTQDAGLATHSFLLVSLLVVGNAINGFMNLPYALQLAHGWTKLAFYQNLIAVIMVVPGVFVATYYWGAVGAAAIWIAVNSSYVLIGIQVMHRRLLKTEKKRWYKESVIFPSVAGGGVAAVLSYAVSMPANPFMVVLSLMMISILIFLSVALALPDIRQRLVQYIYI